MSPRDKDCSSASVIKDKLSVVLTFSGAFSIGVINVTETICYSKRTISIQDFEFDSVVPTMNYFQLFMSNRVQPMDIKYIPAMIN